MIEQKIYRIIRIVMSEKIERCLTSNKAEYDLTCFGFLHLPKVIDGCTNRPQQILSVELHQLL